jgi:hypothetical protein
MATNSASGAHGGSFLLELLYFAGWRLELRDGARTIRAIRGEVELEVSGATRAEGAGVVFARAMRSSRRDRPERG